MVSRYTSVLVWFWSMWLKHWPKPGWWKKEFIFQVSPLWRETKVETRRWTPTIIFCQIKCNKMAPSGIYCSIHRWWYCSVFNREASCSRRQLAQNPHLATVQRTKTVRRSDLSGMSVCMSLWRLKDVHGSRTERLLESKMVDDSKETVFLRYHRLHERMTHSDCDSVHETYSSQAKF